MSIRTMMIGGAGARAPDAPTIGTATAGSSSASVTFSAPANNGGSAITSFTVTSSPSGITGTGASSPITVSGLTNGTAYTFTVTATNAIGTSPASAASNSVTPTDPELYSFTTATFTNASTVGPDGPGIAAARAAVGQPAWTGTYLNMSSPGIQLWTVPKSGNYDIELAGASSVLQFYNSPSNGYGRGAKFTTRYALTYNTVIKILCGQLPANNGGYVTAYNGGTQSSSPGCFNGAGGGTFVTASDNTPIAIAGGGGSNRAEPSYTFNQTNINARMDFNTSGNIGGKSPPGEGTNGGGATNWNGGDGSGGAGLTGDAFGPPDGAGAGSLPARAFINGGRGAILGPSPNNPPAHGGFGGGGHGGWGGSGGAGGYSGGGTGTNDQAAGYGGGGANFNAGTIQVSPVTHSGAGYVKITKV